MMLCASSARSRVGARGRQRSNVLAVLTSHALHLARNVHPDPAHLRPGASGGDEGADESQVAENWERHIFSL